MKSVIRILLFAMLFIYVECNASIAKSPNIIVFHINGVNTTNDEAIDNRDELKATASIDSNIVTWDIIYNPSHGLLASDLLDVLRMKRQESKDLTIDDYVTTYMKAYHLNYPPNSPEYKKLKDEIKQAYMNDSSIVGKNFKEIVDEFHGKVPPPYASVVELLNQYKNVGFNNAYVLLLPHSQGNQYANQLWDFLVKGENFPASHLALFGIASPADEIKGIVDIPRRKYGEPEPDLLIKYITAKNDLVINSLRVLSLFLPATNSPMQGNVEINCYDILRHSLLYGYLFDRNSREIIHYKINLLVISLKIRLIEEGMKNNIRVFFQLPTYIDNTDEIINRRNGEVMCSSNSCDKRIFNYINPMYGWDYDPYFYNFKMVFTNQLEDSEYLYLTNSHSRLTLLVRGNIQRAISNIYDGKKCTYFKSINSLGIEKKTNSPFLGIPYAEISDRNEEQKDCSSALPQMYYKGKMIVGSFTAS